jgi:hypothetical protein
LKRLINPKYNPRREIRRCHSPLAGAAFINGRAKLEVTPYRRGVSRTKPL